MAISTEVRRAGPYHGNGQQTEFPFNFKVFDSSQVRPVFSVDGGKTETVLPSTDFVVTLSVDQDVNPGGAVVLVSPLSIGSILTIISAVPYLQPVVQTNRGGFYPDILNQALDRATAQIQQLAEKQERALTVPATTEKTSEQLIQELWQVNDSAAASASASASSAKSAADSQSAAAESAAAAKTSERAAKSSEENATASKSAAVNSASASATSASLSASQAALAKKWAVQDVEPIEGSGETALYSAREYAKRAGASTQIAVKSKTEAAASASSAAGSASSAGSFASNASTAAAKAADNAMTAQKSQAAAAISASAAAVSAKEAKDAAGQSAAGQLQADWKETNSSAKSFIKNKPEIPAVKDLVLKVGVRGALAGYETPVTAIKATTITHDSPDMQAVAGTITAQSPSANAGFTKVVRLDAETPTVVLSANWTWAGDTAPTLKKGSFVVFCALNGKGIAAQIKGA